MRLVYTTTAHNHVLSAIDWYNDQGSTLGARFVAALRDQERLLSVFPQSSPHVDVRVRRALVPDFPYSVYYHVLQNTVVVVAVIHNSRHPDNWKKIDQPRSS